MKNLSIHGDHETILKARNFLVSKGVNEDEEWNNVMLKDVYMPTLYLHWDMRRIEIYSHNDWEPRESPAPIQITPENYESVLTELINDGSITTAQ